ncbi:MAG: hypothetical protein JWN04_2015 [Myxococcaceae bacterium]|nr:hypothetical protein [Myxococcaceae bacterium]
MSLVGPAERLASLWTVSYSPLRAFWLLRGVYLLLSADLWFEMIEHGGRYGLGDFNVAHFAWLDLVLPLPTPALYVGLLIAAGTISLWLGLGAAPRWLRLTLAAAYTLGWLLSVHDSYQHHYLLSWLLCWCAAVPDLTARRALSDEPVQGWGLPMTCLTCAIVYFFTGISKSEPDWRRGAALRSITHSMPPGSAHPGKFDGARDLLLGLGLDDSSVWQLFALSTIALQWTVSAGYLASTSRDAHASRLRIVLCSLGLVAALSFHALAELFHVFEIGLFSFYMMFIACLLLAPAKLWKMPTRGLAWLSDRLSDGVGQAVVSASESAQRPSGADLARPLLSVALLLAIGFAIPLPGSVWATSVAALLVLVCTVATMRQAEGARVALDALALKTTFSAFVLWLSLTQSRVPFDYYRRTAGELYRMGQLEQALSLYKLAQRYAPSDQSRVGRIRELENELNQGSAKRRF